MNGPTDWLTPIGILLSGLVLGVMFVYAFLRRKGAAAASAAAPDLELIELEAKRDALIQQLRELDDEGITSGEERKRLEVKTAEVLRAIDARAAAPAKRAAATPQRAAEPAAESAPATGFFAQHPAVKGFIWGIASIAAVAALGVFVYKSATDKQAPGAMGGMQTADQTTTDPHKAPPTNDPAVLQLEAAVKAEPDNVDKRIELAKAYLDREYLMGVFEQTKVVLEKNPDEPRAQTYNAIVRMSMGQLAEASDLLDRATAKDPSLVDAWVAKAWINVQKGDKPKGEAAIQQAIKVSPQNAERIKEVWAEMNAPKGVVAQAEPNAPLPADHPQVASMQPKQAPPVDEATAVHLTLMLDPAAKAKNGVVFVVARPAGQTGGAPLAVKKVASGAFPLTIDLSSADSMMGQPLPSKVSIEARLDTDGDAATKSPDEPHAFVDNVSTGIKLAMKLK